MCQLRKLQPDKEVVGSSCRGAERRSSHLHSMYTTLTARRSMCSQTTTRGTLPSRTMLISSKMHRLVSFWKSRLVFLAAGEDVKNRKCDKSGFREKKQKQLSVRTVLILIYAVKLPRTKYVSCFTSAKVAFNLLEADLFSACRFFFVTTRIKY